MKAVVVGGVAGGMSFAARARRLAEDAEIVVLERDRYVSYANCGLPYHLGGEIGDRDALLLHTPQSLAESLALDVRTGPEVLAIDPARRTVAVRELTAHADAAQLSARIAAGEWVADLRSRQVFAAGHVRGSQVAAAQRDLARIGIDHLAGAADGTPQEWAGGQSLESFPVASFADLAAVRRHRPVTILDVRRALEWAGSRLDGALHIPLQDLRARIGEVPGGEIWVHCRSGYRAVIAASLLQAAGHAVVAIDDEYTSAADAGLSLVTGTAAARAA